MWTTRTDREGLTEIIHTVNDKERVYCKYLHLHDAMELVHFLNDKIKQDVAEAVRKAKGDK